MKSIEKAGCVTQREISTGCIGFGGFSTDKTTVVSVLIALGLRFKHASFPPSRDTASGVKVQTVFIGDSKRD